MNSTSLDWRALSAEESEKKESPTEGMDRQEQDRQEPGSSLLDLSEQGKSAGGLFSQDCLSVDDTEHVKLRHQSEQSCSESQDSKNTHQHEQPIGLGVNQKEGGIQGMNYISREPPPLSFASFPEDRIQDSSEQFGGLYDGMEEEDGSESQDNSVYSLSQLDLDTVPVDGEVRERAEVCDSDGGSTQGSVPSLYSQYQAVEDSQDPEHTDKIS